MNSFDNFVHSIVLYTWCS